MGAKRRALMAQLIACCSWSAYGRWAPKGRADTSNTYPQNHQMHRAVCGIRGHTKSKGLVANDQKVAAAAKTLLNDAGSHEVP
ncbi:hypothetical protein PSCICE_18720 [Pseudomonas cichorii]|nr:hypothetical protein PSCICE_18720 [Pseudomonas cichorii]